MKHASHKATTVSRQKFSLAKALFASGKGSHSVRAVRAVQSAGSDAVVLGLDPAIAEKINEIAPQTRRSIREAARAAERRMGSPLAIFLPRPHWPLWSARPQVLSRFPTMKTPRTRSWLIRPRRPRRLSASAM